MCGSFVEVGRLRETGLRGRWRSTISARNEACRQGISLHSANDAAGRFRNTVKESRLAPDARRYLLQNSLRSSHWAVDSLTPSTPNA
jgi:hypothetical protein